MLVLKGVGPIKEVGNSRGEAYKGSGTFKRSVTSTGEWPLKGGGVWGILHMVVWVGLWAWAGSDGVGAAGVHRGGHPAAVPVPERGRLGTAGGAAPVPVPQ